MLPWHRWDSHTSRHSKGVIHRSRQQLFAHWQRHRRTERFGSFPALVCHFASSESPVTGRRVLIAASLLGSLVLLLPIQPALHGQLRELSLALERALMTRVGAVRFSCTSWCKSKPAAGAAPFAAKLSAGLHRLLPAAARPRVCTCNVRVHSLTTFCCTVCLTATSSRSCPLSTRPVAIKFSGNLPAMEVPCPQSMFSWGSYGSWSCI
jgi:hypothetical protein